MKHIVDTHALVWHLAGSQRLGVNAKAVLQNPSSELVLPGIAYAEVCWIVERGRLPTLTVANVRAAIEKDARVTIYALDKAVIDQSQTLTVITEMHDRQIIATALVLAEQGESVALLPQDANITESGLMRVVW